MTALNFVELKNKRLQDYQALAATGADEGALDALGSYLSLFSSKARPEEFLILEPHMRLNFFWRALAAEWSGFDRIPHLLFEDVLCRRRQCWRADHLGSNDAAAYNNLPQELNIFRGQSSGPIGLSWTTDFTVAEGFARGHRGIRLANPVVVAATAHKDDVALVQTERGENEIVLFSAKCARRPTTLNLTP
ncbi:hypothetical protein [Methylocystis sp.]|uniref:hypothetical protein n=1 Tax=Methylocystis sp. TaxID=1911079 RepID=UPI003DA2E720